VGPSYQVPLARAVKSAVRIPVIAVGLISGFDQAEAIVATGDADMIALARAILFDPRWPWHAAAELGAQVRVPSKYLRSEPRRFKGLFAPEAMVEPVKKRRTTHGGALHRSAEKRA
jgi:2,4-dienoyl-CoA reductase-like NADH-dependent reductase (Old Yellow Enzyme family)